MGSLFDNLYDVLFQPWVAMRNMAESKNVGQAISVFFCSILVPIWALYFGLKDTGLAMMFHVLVMFKVIGSLMIWIMGVAIWQLTAEFFGGRGTAVGLFVTLGFAHIPRIFMVPLWAMVTVMPSSTKTFLLSISVLVLVFWSLYLDVVAIREVHQLSTAKSVLVLMSPIIGIGVLCAVIAIFIGSGLINMSM
ncbi:Yip1 family protein [Pelosinus sp. sgz500959]|uniref:Yip1 family protein n=1 Tax=Pelosinus sp. sgz500959 TaxID=3242472 RepID=UPI003671212D